MKQKREQFIKSKLNINCVGKSFSSDPDSITDLLFERQFMQPSKVVELLDKVVEVLFEVIEFVCDEIIESSLVVAEAKMYNNVI